MDEDRQKLFAFINRDLVGPSHENGGDLEEEIFCDQPSSIYFSGALFPQNILAEEVESNESNNGIGLEGQEPQTPKNEDTEKEFSDLSDEQEEYLNLSNAYKQSAISLTIALKRTDSITINVSYGTYQKTSKTIVGEQGGEEKRLYPFKRKQNDFSTQEISEPDMFARANGHSKESIYEIERSDGKPSLILTYYLRRTINNRYVYTISLVNQNNSKSYKNDEKTFFQVEMSVTNSNGFSELPLYEKTIFQDEDATSNALLYRDVHEYAVGHGCSPIWDDRNLDQDGKIKEIRTSFMPFYELQPTVPADFDDIQLDMLKMAEDDDGHFVFDISRKLCDEYEKWIIEKEEKIKTLKLPKILLDYAISNSISSCRECLARMREGISLLSSNQKAYLAFKWMNQTMLTQQLRSKIKTREYSTRKNQFRGDPLTLNDSHDFVEPLFNNPLTWPEYLKKRVGRWHTFQYAFILINIKSIVDPNCNDRKNVELIWFPTGGGKTEAYLGLSSFTILWKRLIGQDHGLCTQIFMRYTLRLLTSQQFDRAASLICACEDLRRKHPEQLGEVPITIGLWVGGDTTPNSEKDAKEKLTKLRQPAGRVGNASNPFLITKCPWCGARMGPSSGAEPIGYMRDLSGHFHFNCENGDCEFCGASGPLPLTVVDEQIYNNPPTLLIGTVDKFAMLPFLKAQARKLFGLEDGPLQGREHPELIIQDELHLISGPLGSMVAAYEIMVDALCSYEDGNVWKKPKIIASTATISRAKEQCYNIFAVDKNRVKIFPPSGIDAGESFFAKVDKKKNGRLYVGVYSPGASSNSFSAIHLLATQFEAKNKIHYNNIDKIDAYWTNVCYFNSLRELGQAATWVNADIREYIRSHFHYPFSPFINPLELTSRTSDGNLSAQLDKLNEEVAFFDGKLIKNPIDICLATNMISVGIDIPRLGLMTIFGQPKTTSEYIQASSRVGRDPERRPGIVYTIYNPGKPRDKSIFESFQMFHSEFYSFVEPTSVSPFAPPLRTNAIPAIFIAIARFLMPNIRDEAKDEDLQETLATTGEVTKKIILDRVKYIDRPELDDAKRQIDDMIRIWKEQSVSRIFYPVMGQDSLRMQPSNQPCAIYPSGYLLPDDSWELVSFGVPTSMRSVDRDCSLKFISRYESEDL